MPRKFGQALEVGEGKKKGSSSLEPPERYAA